MDKRQQDSFKHYFYKFQPLFLMISSVVPYSWEGGLGGLGWKVRANCIEGLCNRCRPFPWWLTTFHANITPRATWKYKKAYEYFWKELLLEKLGVLKIKKKKCLITVNFKVLQDLQWDFPRGPVVENPPANAGDTGSISSLGRSHMLRRNEAHAVQLLSPRTYSPGSNKRSHHNEKLVHRS